MSDKPRTEGQPIHALPMPPYDFQGNPTTTDNLEAGAGDLVERLNSAVALGDMTGARGKNPTNIYNLAAEAAAQLAAVTAENARLREALEPFAALAGSVFRAYEDGREMNASKADDDTVWGFDRVDLTYGALRRARTALSQEAPK